MLPQFCRWHFLFISIIKALNHNNKTSAVSLCIICKHHEILLEARGWEIWMASVHYHDWSSDQGSNDYSNLSLHSWNGEAHSHVASRCRNTTVFPRVHFLTGAAFLVNGLVKWSKTLRPQISRSQLQDFYLWRHTDLVYQQEVEARDVVWDLRFPQWFSCRLRPSGT